MEQDNKNVVANTGAAVETTESTVNTFGANYTLGATKLFLLNQTHNTYTNSTNITYTGYSVSHTMGATTLLAQFGTLKDKLDNDKSKLMGLGLDYASSKRTIAYVRNEDIKEKGRITWSHLQALQLSVSATLPNPPLA